MSTFTPGIPAANNRPSFDQPLMLGNFTAIQQDLDVNHVAISDVTNRGKHTFVTLFQPTTPAAPSGTESNLYSINGIAKPAVPQIVYQNAQVTIPVSAVKAYGRFTQGTAAYTTSYNTQGNPSFSGNLTAFVDLSNNLITTSAAVLVTCDVGGAAMSYSISLVGSTPRLTLTRSALLGVNTPIITFLVLEM